MTGMQRLSRSFPALVAGAMVTAGTVQAAPVTIDMGRHYWANTAVPNESGPWLRATFAQSGTDSVTLTLRNLLSDPQANVHRWAFNLDPRMDLNDLQITQSSGPMAQVLKNNNGVHVAGGSMFDIRFMWPGNPGRIFDAANDTVTFTFNMEGLTPQSFLWGSVGGHPSATNMASVAWLHNVNGAGVTWVTHAENSPSVAPLPPAVWAGAAGLALAGLYVRRRRQ
jgi:hypothetical protein